MAATVDPAQHEQDLQHEEWLATIAAQLAPIFEHSKDGVFVYLDDRHKICNDKLARMWGYANAAEWAASPDFLEAFVATHDDRVRVSTSYHENVHRELTAYTLRYTIRRKDGHTRVVDTTTVPYALDGQLFAYTFVRQAAPTRKSR